MSDFPLPVGITTRASSPPSTALIGCHWPGRKSEWPKRSPSSLRAASLLIRCDTGSGTGTKHSSNQTVYPTYPREGCGITSPAMPDSSSSSFKVFTSTGPGLESIAAGELKALGIRGRQEIGGVAFSADLQRLYEANLWLRTATRVLVRLGSFHASTFYELERRAKKLPWAEFLPASGKVRVRVTCRKSKLYHSDAVGERVLSAIIGSASRAIEGNTDASETLDSPDFETESAGKSGQLFVVRIVNDECEISADSSGEMLHRRGYRQEIAKAPLRETIAAGVGLARGGDR